MRVAHLLVFLILLGATFSGVVMSAGYDYSSPNDIPSHIVGDWIISSGESVSLEGQSVEIKGNVIIENGATLTLRSDSKLIVNSSYDGQYSIFVRRKG